MEGKSAPQKRGPQKNHSPGGVSTTMWARPQGDIFFQFTKGPSSMRFSILARNDNVGGGCVMLLNKVAGGGWARGKPPARKKDSQIQHG